MTDPKITDAQAAALATETLTFSNAFLLELIEGVSDPRLVFGIIATTLAGWMVHNGLPVDAGLDDFCRIVRGAAAIMEEARATPVSKVELN